MTTMTHPGTNGKATAPLSTGDSPPPKLVRFGDVLGAFRADAQAAFDARVHHTPRGPVTGLRELDDVLGSVLQPGVHIVQGGSGVGKTAYALQVAATCGYPALFVSCEMHLVELLRRHTARVTGTYLDRLKSGELAPDDAVRKAEQAIAAAPWLALVDATQSHLTPPLLKDFAQAVKGDARHVLVVVDSVHSWAEASPLGLSEYDTLNAHLGELRRIAALLNCPILGVAERNRVSMKEGGLNSAAGSRKFEYGAESVVGLAVDDGKDAPVLPPPQKPITLTVEKNRNGASGMRLKAVFNGALQRFADREPAR
jgi:replicative DNA helicase